jgi:hypothetical protein
MLGFNTSKDKSYYCKACKSNAYKGNACNGKACKSNAYKGNV